MKTALMVLMILSAPLFAADEFNTVYDCHTPGIADGGYIVTVQTGGFAGLTQVILSEDGFVGSRQLATFVVRSSTEGDSTVYTGNNLRLVVGPPNPHVGGIPRNVYDATFAATVNGHLHQGTLRCWRPGDPQ